MMHMPVFSSRILNFDRLLSNLQLSCLNYELVFLTLLRKTPDISQERGTHFTLSMFFKWQLITDKNQAGHDLSFLLAFNTENFKSCTQTIYFGDYCTFSLGLSLHSIPIFESYKSSNSFEKYDYNSKKTVLFLVQ